MNITIVDDAPASDIMRLEAHLDAFNRSKTGIATERSLSALLRRDGELFAGIHAQTWGDICYVKLLWVADAERGQGLGSALMEAVELEARKCGCRQIMLWTHSFQAPDFYARHGFERVITVPDNPLGHTDILMVKRL